MSHHQNIVTINAVHTNLADLKDKVVLWSLLWSFLPWFRIPTPIKELPRSLLPLIGGKRRHNWGSSEKKAKLYPINCTHQNWSYRIA
jgi:hypothetical protein